MALIVQKYGGTSVGNPERILNVARRVVATQEGCNQVVCVVSAMIGVTDNLIKLAPDVCQIYTDGDGVYTCDPRLVPTARKIDEISYDEMLELAASGAKVMQSRSVEFAKKFGVVFEVRSSFNQNPGTLVKEETMNMEQ